MFEPKKYSSLFFGDLVQANERRIHELQQERLYHRQMIYHYEDSLTNGIVQNRRFQFKNFVASKLQEERMMRQISQQIYHVDYLYQMKKLKDERQKLNKEIGLNRSYYTQNNGVQIGYRNENQKIFDRKSWKNEKVLRKQIQKGKIERRQEQEAEEKEEKKKNDINITKKQEMKKQLTDNEKYLQQLNIKIKKLNKIYPCSNQKSLNSSFSKPKTPNLCKLNFQPKKIDKQVSFACPSLNKSSSPIRIQDEDLQDEKIQKREEKVLFQIKNDKESNLLRERGISRIRKRIEFSAGVFQDSEYRIIAHEKNHLKMKFMVEQKQRKEMVERICNNERTIKNYGYLLLGQTK